jgi:hypothetical protein
MSERVDDVCNDSETVDEIGILSKCKRYEKLHKVCCRTRHITIDTTKMSRN